MVAGEPRVRYLHTEPGAAADVQAAWSEVVDGWAQVYSREQAVATGMFGPVNPTHLARIGDVVVVCTGDAAVLATEHEPPESARLIGFHGAATRSRNGNSFNRFQILPRRLTRRRAAPTHTGL